jgi:hypothetical protein
MRTFTPTLGLDRPALLVVHSGSGRFKDQPPTPGSLVGSNGGIGVIVLGGLSEGLVGLGSTLASLSGAVVLLTGVGGVSVGVAVGISDAGALGLRGKGGAVGFRGPGWSLMTCPIVVPLPLPPMVSPLAHSNPVMSIMASRKAPSAPNPTAPQRSEVNCRKRSSDCGLSVSCSLLSGPCAAAGEGRSVLDPSPELGNRRVRWARERTLSRLRSREDR